MSDRKVERKMESLKELCRKALRLCYLKDPLIISTGEADRLPAVHALIRMKRLKQVLEKWCTKIQTYRVVEDAMVVDWQAAATQVKAKKRKADSPAPATGKGKGKGKQKRRQEAEVETGGTEDEAGANSSSAVVGTLAVVSHGRGGGRGRGSGRSKDAAERTAPGVKAEQTGHVKIEQTEQIGTVGHGQSTVGRAQSFAPNPRKALSCYSVLDLPRTATKENINRAFRKLALRYHPDKPGGDHKIFLCVNEAFEVLSNATSRAQYDADIAFYKSSDGSDGNSVDVAMVDRSTNCPEMLCHAFLSCDPGQWDTLFEILTVENIDRLFVYLMKNELTDEVEEPLIKESESGTTAVPGIKRAGRGQYHGKIAVGNLLICTFNTSMENAVDGRIALQSLCSRIQELQALGNSYNDSVLSATTEVRKSEQSSAFYMRYSYEFQRGRAFRLTSPTTTDVREPLHFRSEAERLWDADEEEEIRKQKIRKLHQQLLSESKGRQKKANKERETRLPQLKSKVQEVQKRNAKLFKITAPNKVAILSEASVEADVKGYVVSGTVLGVIAIERDSTTGRAFLKLADGSGNFVPECSRKDPSRVIAEQMFGRSAKAICDEEKGLDSGESSSSSNSSSSSAGL